MIREVHFHRLYMYKRLNRDITFHEGYWSLSCKCVYRKSNNIEAKLYFIDKFAILVSLRSQAYDIGSPRYLSDERRYEMIILYAKALIVINACVSVPRSIEKRLRYDIDVRRIKRGVSGNPFILYSRTTLAVIYRCRGT